MAHAGDLYIFMTEDGGDMHVQNGEPETDTGLETAVTLAVCGHDGTDLWLNEYMDESEKLHGYFVRFLKKNPKTVKNMNQAVGYLKKDLQCFLDDGVVDTIDVSVSSSSPCRIDYNIEMYADGETVYKNTYQVNWNNQRNDPASGRIE